MSGILDIFLGNLFETPQQTRDRLLRQTAQARQQREAQCRIPGPVGTTPPAQACYALLTGRAEGQNVLFEYDEDGRLMQELTYSNGRGRRHYRVGDIFMLSELPVRTVERIFPELHDEGSEDDTLLLDLALGFLGEPPPQYKIGWKIMEIGSESSPGNGSVGLRGVIFFGGHAVELQRTRSETSRQLAGDFYQLRVANRLAAMIPILEAVAQLAADAASGAGRGVARQVGRWTLRGALRITFRRVLLRRLLRSLLGRTVRTAAAATLAFARGFATEMRNRDLEARLRQRAGARTINPEDVRPCLVAGVREFVKVLLNEMGAALMARFRSGLEGVNMDELQNRVAAAIAEEVVQALVADMPGVFLEAAAAAANRPPEAEGGFAQEFGRRLGDGLQDHLLGLIRNILTRPGRSLTEAMNE